ncbi:MAG: cell division protein ZapB [Magnetococcales bacterium]|nr:cell division protein ZapB [Magnetococcales bacterium]
MEEMSELSIPQGQSDPLSVLEQQWQTMIDVVRRLRKENGDLLAQLQERQTRLQQVEYELTQTRQNVSALQQEKNQVATRISEMLTRFNESGQAL